MRRSRMKSVAFTAVTGTALVLFTANSAFADYYGTETDYAVAHSAPTGTYYCSAMSGARACFKPDGDEFYISDDASDGYAAVAEWFSAGSGRYGSCVNKLGAGKWGVCNKNLPEEDAVEFNPALYNNGNLVERSDGYCAVGVDGRSPQCS